MVNYQLGKIYKITGNGKTYVGSTCCPLLSQRLAKHRDNYKQYLNKKYDYVTSFECVSDPNCKIELLELCPCSCYDELVKCEAKWIRELDCTNKVIPTRTKAEWYDDNKDKILEQRKEYYLDNRDKILEHQKQYNDLEKRKQYREANRDAILEYQKKYHEANKDLLNAKKRERYRQRKEQKNQINIYQITEID